MAKDFDSAYWGQVVRRLDKGGREELWRAYCQWVYGSLMDRWLKKDKAALALKTDLYDEAIASHNLVDLLRERFGKAVGTDLSFDVASSAQARMKADSKRRVPAAVSDARKLALRPGSLGVVLSTSTLDHFESDADIHESLKELAGALKPGGALVITLDNPVNPVVFVRNALPYRLLKRLGIINYFVGRTLSRQALERALEACGLMVEASTSIIHAPRILAMRCGRLVDRIGNDRLKIWFLMTLRFFELLERLPTRDLTGYFVAVKAVKKK
jgi:SAM-dependent methyltransferase